MKLLCKSYKREVPFDFKQYQIMKIFDFLPAILDACRYGIFKIMFSFISDINIFLKSKIWNILIHYMNEMLYINLKLLSKGRILIIPTFPFTVFAFRQIKLLFQASVILINMKSQSDIKPKTIISLF